MNSYKQLIRRFMGKTIRTFCVLSFFIFITSFQHCYAQGNPQSVSQTKPIYEFIERILPGDSQHFKVEIVTQEEGKDIFEIESKSDKIILRGNNGISIASALNYYLKYYAHCDISWNGINLNLPHPLPIVPQKIRQLSPYKYRYYFNYCTFNYTASWWDWSRWQKEIDFMALNGINLPLALTGQNSVWKRVYKSMGFTDKELESFFPGPAYFSWFWMGNLDGYNGPLPNNWMKSHEELQKKILLRERELGMTPVLPAFTGHVPPAFKDKFPRTKLIKTIWDDAEFGPVYSIDPTDTMFAFIGKKFLTEQTKIFGTNHLYSSDTFNENKPPSNDTTFLNRISKKVYSSMALVDSQAIWVMQGWMFAVDKKFWQPEQIKALLGPVPNDKMLILDLWSELRPVWDKTDAYYGKGWIWCMLHNFGGKHGMFGDIETLANQPARTLHDSRSGNMLGIGITAEGIEQNPAAYSIMLDNVWRSETIDPIKWLNDYTVRRYGKKNSAVEKAWEVLHKTVYNQNSIGSPESIITLRPTMEDKKHSTFSNLKLPYNEVDLLPAWNSLIEASEELKYSDGFSYDLIDVTRQVLSNYNNELYKKLITSYHAGNLAEVKEYGKRFLEVIDDLDILLATRKEFMLGKWLNDAKKWGQNDYEKKIYEKNARNLITTWGDKNSILADYARKQWSGLIKDFYKPRWIKFINQIVDCLEKNRDFNQKLFDEEIKSWEWNWVNENKLYPQKPKRDPIITAVQIHNKYSCIVKAIYSN